MLLGRWIFHPRTKFSCYTPLFHLAHWELRASFDGWLFWDFNLSWLQSWKGNKTQALELTLIGITARRSGIAWPRTGSPSCLSFLWTGGYTTSVFSQMNFAAARALQSKKKAIGICCFWCHVVCQKANQMSWQALASWLWLGVSKAVSVVF